MRKWLVYTAVSQHSPLGIVVARIINSPNDQRAFAAEAYRTGGTNALIIDAPHASRARNKYRGMVSPVRHEACPCCGVHVGPNVAHQHVAEWAEFAKTQNEYYVRLAAILDKPTAEHDI